MKIREKYKVEDYKLKVKKSAAGKGLFATIEIPKGTCYTEYIGKKVSKEEQFTINSRYLFHVGKGGMINGNIPKNIARYINHSCVPNSEVHEADDRIYMLALRTITPGEELTYDYGKEYFDEYLKNTCLCPKCRLKRKK